MIDQYAINYNSIIMVGDFNFSGMSWHGADACEDTLCESMFRNLITEHQLQQLITKPTRGNAILDLVFVSNSIIVDEISCLPPILATNSTASLLGSLRSQISLLANLPYLKWRLLVMNILY